MRGWPRLTATGLWVLSAMLTSACDSVLSSAPVPTSTPGSMLSPGPVPTSIPGLGQATTLSELRQRPLRFPALAAADPCPESAQVPVRPNPSKPAEVAFGSGPAYLNGNNSWFAGPPGQGANLLFDTQNSGPMLVRTRRLDGEGHLSLRNSGMPDWARESWRLIAAEASDGLEIQVAPVSGHWPVWSGQLTSNRPGCFGIQVDGDGFAGIVVIMVLPGTAPPA